MAQLLYQIIFYLFSGLLLCAAIGVISAPHPVRAVLLLVVVFFCSTVLWLLLQAEFLALLLIFVYVGAVMTLFLFVVMMLNLNTAPRQKGWVRYLPFGIALVGLLLILMWRVLQSGYFSTESYHWVTQAQDYSNTDQLGAVLYTYYAYPFELAAVLLLAAIVATIALAFRGPKVTKKIQKIPHQLEVSPQTRLTLIDLPIHVPGEKR